jgi:zinc protease
MTLVTAVPSAPPALDAVDVTAPSGLRIIAAARTGAPIVEVRLVVPFGLDDPATAAAGELLGATLFGGAAGRNRAALDRDLARSGAAWSAAVHPEQLTITAYALADRLTDLLDLLVGALSTATYPDADVAGQRARLAHRIAAHAAQPHVQARDALLTRCFGDHPAAREHPDPAAVRTVDATVLRALHRDRVVPSGSTLVLAGDLNPDVAAGLAIRATAGWRGDGPAHRLSDPPSPMPGPVALLDGHDERQVVVGISGAAPVDAESTYPAAYLANLVLGGYFGARLFARLREDRHRSPSGR